MTEDRSKAVRDLLLFYQQAGVETLVGETPVNRFAEEDGSTDDGCTASPRVTSSLAGEVDRRSAAKAGGRGMTGDSAPSSTPLPNSPPQGGREHAEFGARFPPAPAPLPLPPEAAVAAANESATTAASLDELRAMLDRFEGCALKKTATQLVFADGNPQARVMFVGEAPGRDEDICGLPFVGRSGQLLDRMLAAIGLDRSSAYIANIIPWRPPGNRTPTPQESQICLPFIRRQIELVDPDILVCLGGPSTQTLLGVKDGIMRTRGRWFAYHTGTREIRALATFHPAFLLRSPLQKRIAWRDFLAIKKALGADVVL